MVFTGSELYLAFILSEIGKLFLVVFFMYNLDNTLVIYINYIFEVACKNEKNI